MTLNLENLELPGVRKLMLEEFEKDIALKVDYNSPRLKEEHKETYNKLMRESIEKGNDSSLAEELVKNNCIKTHEETKNGIKKVPWNAHQVLAEGEFNRFCIRAVCCKAIEENKEIEVYRAKEVTNPRPESVIMIGKLLNPKKILEDLRKNIGVDTAFGLPAGPNSGLSGRIKK